MDFATMDAATTTTVTFTQILCCIALGFTVTWALIPFICHYARRRKPSPAEGQFHHSHREPISRLGGLALAAGFGGVALAASFMIPATGLPARMQWIICASALAMFGLGFLDDLRPLGAKFKLLGQIAIASGVYFAGIQIQVIKNPLTHVAMDLGALSYVATVLWLVALTNLINLVDGMDGLAAGICFMLMCLLAHMGVGVSMAFTTLLTVGMAAVLLGFLYYNFPPAKIYMGDGGAYFLGFLIGLLSILNSHKGSVAAALIAPLFALTLPIVDVSLAILRRGLKGLPIFRPDQKHIHHALLKFGFSRERAVLLLYTFSVASLFLAFGVFWSQGRLLPLLLGFLFLMILVTARSVGLVNNWFSVKTRLSKSLALRVETRYALTLSSWMEMESERRVSVYELWEDYQFVVKKLGFSRVSLALPDGTNIWDSPAFDPDDTNHQEAAFDLNGCGKLEFVANHHVMQDKLFELLSELAAEAWHKAASRWQKLNRAPIQFASAVSHDKSIFQRRKGRAYTPDTAELWARNKGLKTQST